MDQMNDQPGQRGRWSCPFHLMKVWVPEMPSTGCELGVAEWVTGQARNLSTEVAEQAIVVTFLVWAGSSTSTSSG
jgi:hypothetical protein